MILKLKRTPGIYLVGFMGSGKSTVGRALAEELGWNFGDLDYDIEQQARATVTEIFEKYGEPVFREMETTALRGRVHTIQMGHPHVISLGGGAFLTEENYELVSNHGVTVWLDCPLAVIHRRIAHETHRPLARDLTSLQNLFDARRTGYARADYRIEVPDDDPTSVVSRILALPLFTP